MVENLQLISSLNVATLGNQGALDGQCQIFDGCLVRGETMQLEGVQVYGFKRLSLRSGHGNTHTMSSVHLASAVHEQDHQPQWKVMMHNKVHGVITRILIGIQHKRSRTSYGGCPVWGTQVRCVIAMRVLR